VQGSRTETSPSHFPSCEAEPSGSEGLRPTHDIYIVLYPLGWYEICFTKRTSLPPCARGPGPAPCSIGLLSVRSCSMSPREARCEAASAALLASRLARPPVSALRASHPWLLLDAFRRTPLRPLQKLLGLGVLAHRRCRCAPALAFRPPPPSLLSSRSCLFTNRFLTRRFLARRAEKNNT
jgi:hypothetical protein